ncbi:MAG: glycosyltransferase [Planctomycetes bacterium]|nr:glycosyltransferase [Planctomycetota bacterium]
MHALESFIQVAYVALLAPLALLGLHRGYLILLWLRYHKRAPQPAATTDNDTPTVLIQLPIFNERYVAARLVESVAKMRHPRDKLCIQVLDDSTDDTTEIVAQTLRALPDDLRIEHIRRGTRVGYKAGALDHGLTVDKSEFVAVFDADFVPPDDFLERTLPWFGDPKIGMVQTRWGHLNPTESLLTETQSTLLDGHFLIEHVARSRAGYFFNFNGTGGIFRRRCIDEAGGWEHDTITEDLDLSYRAQLVGWRFAYLPHVVCPAELPPDMNAFQSQQFRWSKGAIQVGRKLIARVLQSEIGFRRKLEAVIHLFGNFAFPLILGIVLLGLPLQLLRLWNETEVEGSFIVLEASPLFGATISVFSYYGIACWLGGRRRATQLLRVPWVVAMGATMCINSTAAVVSAFDRDPGEFVRTPKRADSRQRSNTLYRTRRGLLPWFEMSLAVWAAMTCISATILGLPAPAIFHGLFAGGLFWSGWSSLQADREAQRSEPDGDVALSSVG